MKFDLIRRTSFLLFVITTELICAVIVGETKPKKKKKGFFETLGLTRTSSHDDNDETSPSPNDKDSKKGFTNKIKNLFKFKRRTAPKPLSKNAGAESGESEDDSDTEEHKDH